MLALLNQNDKGLQTEICNPLVILVRPAGFEPTTPWFVARYSIQLSYGRYEVQKYSSFLTSLQKGDPRPAQANQPEILGKLAALMARPISI